MDNQHGNIQELYDTAYSFGLILGDGSLAYYAARNVHTLKIEMLDAECLSRVAEQIKNLFGNKYVGGCITNREGRQRTWILYVSGKEVWDFFAGPTEFKQIIPQIFFSAPSEVQKELIAGLMDSDGCCEEFKQGNSWKYKIVFSNNKLEIVKGLASLWRLNGCSVGELKTSIEYTGKPQYRLSPNIYDFARNCYFRCERKQERVERFKKLRCASETLYTTPTSG
jgi:hypothetical protein